MRPLVMAAEELKAVTSKKIQTRFQKSKNRQNYRIEVKNDNALKAIPFKQSVAFIRGL